MIVDYENPFKKMMEEFVPHGKVRGDESIALLHNNILQKSEELWPKSCLQRVGFWPLESIKAFVCVCMCVSVCVWVAYNVLASDPLNQ